MSDTDNTPAETPGPKAYDKTLAKRYLAALDAGREAYGKADEIVAKLHSRNPVGTRIDLSGGHAVELVDNFADSNVAWKPSGVKRLDAKLHKPRKPRSSKAKPKTKTKPKK